MHGDERERFCAKCSRTVVNLSQLTTAERRTLLAETDPRDLCVAYYQRLSGEYVTAEQPLTAAESRRVVQLGVTAFALGAAATALHYASPMSEPILRAQSDIAARIADVRNQVAERTTELIDQLGEQIRPQEAGLSRPGHDLPPTFPGFDSAPGTMTPRVRPSGVVC